MLRRPAASQRRGTPRRARRRAAPAPRARGRARPRPAGSSPPRCPAPPLRSVRGASTECKSGEDTVPSSKFFSNQTPSPFEMPVPWVTTVPVRTVSPHIPASYARQTRMASLASLRARGRQRASPCRKAQPHAGAVHCAPPQFAGSCRCAKRGVGTQTAGGKAQLEKTEAEKMQLSPVQNGAVKSIELV